jgi:hypothetical protein
VKELSLGQIAIVAVGVHLSDAALLASNFGHCYLGRHMTDHHHHEILPSGVDEYAY